MRKYLLLFGVFALGTTAFFAGCLMMPPSSKIPRPVADAFDDSDRAIVYSFTLYSLEPAPAAMTGPPNPLAPTFHGQTILGETKVTDSLIRRKLVAAFYRGVSDHDGSVAACFIPHHGIRVQKGKDTIDLVICFMCAQVKVYVNNKETETLLISTSPRGLFNEVLERARVPLSDKAK
jgi:hypothetical protein